MTKICLAGDFNVNGKASIGMDVDASKAVRFNIESGFVAVVATNHDGRTVKGIAVETQATLDSINHLGRIAVRDESIRMPVIA